MYDTMETILAARLALRSVTTAPYDADRRFLFGYSAGGMMAHRLMAEQPEMYAAIWVYATSYGGRRNSGFGPNVAWGPRVPSGGTNYAHSLFHLHGGADENVKPGGWSQTNWMLASDKDEQRLVDAGVTSPNTFARADYTNRSEVDAYANHNNTTSLTVLMNQPTIIGSANDAIERRLIRTGGGNNPEVVYYRDPALTHYNLPTNRTLFTAQDAWDWLIDHPRVV